MVMVLRREQIYSVIDCVIPIVVMLENGDRISLHMMVSNSVADDYMSEYIECGRNLVNVIWY